MHPWVRVGVVYGVAGLVLTLQIPLEAQAISSACPATTKTKKIAKDTSCLPLCLCPTQVPQRRMSVGRVRTGAGHTNVRATLRGTRHRARKATSQGIGTLRLWRRAMLSRSLLMGQGQQARLLDSWKIRLIDGDTFAYGAERFRIRGINAPEVSESGGFEATQRLDLLLHEGPVLVIPQGVDTYGRTLADVYVNDANVAEVLKEEGYAKAGAR